MGYVIIILTATRALNPTLLEYSARNFKVNKHFKDIFAKLKMIDTCAQIAFRWSVVMLAIIKTRNNKNKIIILLLFIIFGACDGQINTKDEVSLSVDYFTSKVIKNITVNTIIRSRIIVI